MKDEAMSVVVVFQKQRRETFLRTNPNSSRIEKMMTVAELAAAIHRPLRTAENWLCGMHVPDAQTQAAALDALATFGPSARRQREMQRLH